MKRRREQILGMSYRMWSLNFLLEEEKLRDFGLLGKSETTNDAYYPKYVKWTDVPALHSKTPPPRLVFDPRPSANLVEKPTEQEGIEY